MLWSYISGSPINQLLQLKPFIRSREYIAVELTETMEEDAVYDIKFYLKRVGFATIAAPVSCHFWTNAPYQQPTSTNNAWGNIIPNGTTSIPITDTSWTEIQFYHVASGNENYISFGNHFFDSQTELVETLPHPSPCQVNFNGEGYTFIDDVSVIMHPVPYAVRGDTTICIGETATLEAHGVDFSGWSLGTNPEIISSNPTLTFSPAQQETYRAWFGENFIDRTIYIANYPEVELGPDVTMCMGDTLTLDVTQEGMTYRWQDDSYASVYSITEENDYILRVTSAAGCAAFDTMHVDVSSRIDLGFDYEMKFCEDDSLTIFWDHEDQYNYLWSDGETDDSIVVNTTGWFWLESTFGECIYRDSAYATRYEYPNVYMGEDIMICEGLEISFDFTGEGHAYGWKKNGVTVSTSPTYTITSPGTYTSACSVSSYVVSRYTFVVFDFSENLMILP